MATVGVLSAARERITPPERWMQGGASDTLDFLRGYAGSRALILQGRRWSAVGAVACEAESFADWDDALSLFGQMARLEVIEAAHPDWDEERIAEETQVPIQIATFNDTHSHAEVLATLDRAIADAAEGQGRR